MRTASGLLSENSPLSDVVTTGSIIYIIPNHCYVFIYIYIYIYNVYIYICMCIMYT